MPKRGLNREIVVDAAIDLIEKTGYENFSMRELAGKLRVKPASLYNHIEGAEALRLEVGRHAISALVRAEEAAAQGKERDEAILALAGAYHRYAREHLNLYRIIMTLRMMEHDPLLDDAQAIVEPILQVLGQYVLEPLVATHLQRMLRSLIHGFIAHENSGYFSHAETSVEESFWFAVRGFLDRVHSEERRALESSFQDRI